MDQTTQQSLELMKASLSEPLQKSFTQPAQPANVAGFQIYNLETPAKTLYPVLTPFRNRTPRAVNGKSTAVAWKAVTAINTADVDAGVEEGKRGGVIATTLEDFVAPYKGFGLEDDVTYEAEYASVGFESVRARAVEGLLRSVMIAEERIMVGANSTVALGTGPTPTGVSSTTGGTVAASVTNHLIVVPLTCDGIRRATVAVAGCLGRITRNNADGTTTTIDTGNGAASAQSAAVTTTGATSSITWTWADVRGAFGYAVYAGNTAGAANLTLSAIVKANRWVQTAPASAGTQAANHANVAADYSMNTKLYDGRLAFLSKSNVGSYYKSLDGAQLTADSGGKIAAIDDMLQAMWDSKKLFPDELWMSLGSANAVDKLILASGNSPAFRITIPNGQSQGNMVAGAVVGEYMGRTDAGGKPLVIRVHPDIPDGVIYGESNSLPYQLSGVTNLWEIELRQEYYMREWPPKTRKYEYGVYFDGVQKCYAPFAMAIIKNFRLAA